VSAGVFLVAALLFLLGNAANSHSLLTLIAPLVALIFLGITNLLLVLDLERPERFWRVMLWPHWASWLVIGAYILAAYGALVTITAIAALAGWSDAHRVLLLPTMALAVAAASYSAFLLAQAKGRDLWQSPLLPAQLAMQAASAGAAALAVLALFLDRGAGQATSVVLSLTLGASLLLVLTEINLPHVTAHAHQAVQNMTEGDAALPFWGGALLAGMAVPLILALWAATGGPVVAAAVAGVLALAGLAIYETLYINAGQSVPQS
jgi:formate-dependent nitrite reductase membrane component NrfD